MSSEKARRNRGRTILFVDYQNMYRSARDAFGWKSAPTMMQRRLSAWIAEAPGVVQVFPRPLRYSRRYPQGQEKGVDVELAIDLVSLALDDAFDALVLGSADSDLVPALQFVADRYPAKEIITLGYKEEPGFENEAPAPLDLPRGNVQRRLINRTQFDPMIDRRNFFEEQSDESKRLDGERWERIKSRYESR